MSPTHILFEFASGYAIFEKVQVDEISLDSAQMQDSFLDLENFGRIMRLKTFFPFKNAAHALENINDISEGILNDYLREFLEINLASSTDSKKSSKRNVVLGVLDKNLAGCIRQNLGITCESGSDVVNELIRAIRMHSYKLFSQFKKGDFEKAQLGLGHSYSRAKVKFNVNRSDNMIIQSICLLDQMDKDINTFAMRVREWYSWHFPELAKLIPDNYAFAKLVNVVQDKNSLSAESLTTIENALDEINKDKASLILEAAKSSMGTDISTLDMLNITNFARRVVSLTDYRNQLSSYLSEKMSAVAPNLATLIGDIVGARLISRAGSLTNLSKAPASTVQILGAEKALFRALKTKGKTPKYGIIYHSTFIGKSQTKNKGRISRYLANKCSIASRIDCFSEVPCAVFGEALKKQVEERLQFYEDGHCPRTNLEVMREATKTAEKACKHETEDESVSVKQRKVDEDKKVKKEKSEKNIEKEKSDEKDKTASAKKKEKSEKKESSKEVAKMEDKKSDKKGKKEEEKRSEVAEKKEDKKEKKETSKIDNEKKEKKDDLKKEKKEKKMEEEKIEKKKEEEEKEEKKEKKEKKNKSLDEKPEESSAKKSKSSKSEKKDKK